MGLVAILLGWWFATLGRDWLLAYIVFGGVIILAIFAVLDEKTRPTGRSGTVREFRTSGSTDARACATAPYTASSPQDRGSDSFKSIR